MSLTRDQGLKYLPRFCLICQHILFYFFSRKEQNIPPTFFSLAIRDGRNLKFKIRKCSSHHQIVHEIFFLNNVQKTRNLSLLEINKIQSPDFVRTVI